ncbi:histone deacetylase family protein, partial [Ancylostoma caninum]
MSDLPFGYVYDERMLEHECAYDETMQERPERMVHIHNRLDHDGLLKGAVKVEAREATDSELMLNHPGDLVRELDALSTDEECEEYCRDKEILWLCPKSAQAARVAAGGTIELVKANIEGRVGNSFAIVRPPGHHAFGRVPQGYCVFNNVAVAAKYAVEHLGIKKVAVVDFDYHAGNGTHYCLRGDPRFHFTSFHAYHHGSFWPYSSEFDYDTQYENTLMFPLNGALNTEGDYISAFHHVLLPMLRCFKPEAYLSSYRPGSILATTIYRERKAKASKPMGLFGHMVRMLNEICPNRVIAVLEGGYYVTNYTEAASMMVRGLQGLPLPQLSIGKLSPAFKETIWNNLVHHAPRYPLLHQWLRKLQANQVTLKHGLPEYKPRPTLYLGKGMRELWEETKRTRAVRTREWFPELTRDEKKLCDEAIAAYVKTYNYTAPTEDPSEQFLMQQMTWTERSGVEAFAHSAPICLHFVHEFTDFLEGKRQSVMICDRELMPVNCFSISCA